MLKLMRWILFSIFIPALSEEISGFLLLNCSVCPSICHFLHSKTVHTSYKSAKWSLGDWFGVPCCFVNNVKKKFGCPGDQIIGKKKNGCSIDAQKDFKIFNFVLVVIRWMKNYVSFWFLLLLFFSKNLVSRA